MYSKVFRAVAIIILIPIVIVLLVFAVMVSSTGHFPSGKEITDAFPFLKPKTKVKTTTTYYLTTPLGTTKLGTSEEIREITTPTTEEEYVEEDYIQQANGGAISILDRQLEFKHSPETFIFTTMQIDNTPPTKTTTKFEYDGESTITITMGDKAPIVSSVSLYMNYYDEAWTFHYEEKGETISLDVSTERIYLSGPLGVIKFTDPIHTKIR